MKTIGASSEPSSSPRAQRRILPHRQRLFLPVSNEHECRLLRNQNARLEFHRLAVTREAPRFQADVLELRFHVGGGLLESWRAHIAPFERVGSQEFDVAPPSFAFGRWILDDEREKSDEQVSMRHDGAGL
jgi:hypothetical protein